MSDGSGSKTRVIVFMGGESGEHDISLESGASVVKSLPGAEYEPIPLVIGRDGRFGFTPVEDPTRSVHTVGLGEAVYKLMSLGPDCAFIAMHGPYGEDGRVRALCDLMHLPCVGSDMTGSALAMDKWLSKAVYRCAGIPTPEAILLDETRLAGDLDDALDEVVEEVGLPCFVKPTRLGSSVDMGRAETRDELEEMVDRASRHGQVMCEALHDGRELTVPVLEDPDSGRAEALPVIEIIPAEGSEFFDYGSKYGKEGVEQAEEVCPAEIDDDLAEEVSDLAVKAHEALMLSGLSRTDFMVGDDGVQALETNTMPGLTEVSLFPKAAEAAGIPFHEMLMILIRGVMNREG